MRRMLDIIENERRTTSQIICVRARHRHTRARASAFVVVVVIYTNPSTHKKMLREKKMLKFLVFACLRDACERPL